MMHGGLKKSFLLFFFILIRVNIIGIVKGVVGIIFFMEKITFTENWRKRRG